MGANATQVYFRDATTGDRIAVDSAHPLPTDASFSGALSENVAQFGGSNVVTGTGAAGAGIPRVTVSNDSTHPVTQSGVWSVELLDSGGINSASISAAGAIKVDGSAVTQPVSAASLPLPAGASTSALQTTMNTTLGSPMQQTGGTVGLVAGAAIIGAVTQSGTWTDRIVGNAGATLDATLAAGTAPTNGLAVLGQFTTTPPALTTGQTGSVQTDANSNLRIIQATPSATGADAVSNTAINSTMPVNTNTATIRLAPSAKYLFNGTTWDRARGAASSGQGLGVQLVEESGRSFSHISTNTTTTAKSGAGNLHSITVNTAGTTDTITVYDNTAGSGTVIAIINDAGGVGTYTFDVAFATGLTLVTAGTTAPDITVSYR